MRARFAIAGDGPMVRVHDTESGSVKTIRVPGRRAPDQLDLSDDGSLLAVPLMLSRSVSIIDVKSGKEVASVPVESSECKLSPDGRYLLANDALWDLWNRRAIVPVLKLSDRSYDTNRHDVGGFARATFSADGKLAAASGTRYDEEDWIRVWDVEARARLYTIRGDNPTFSPDGRVLAVSTGDPFGKRPFFRLTLYDARSGKQKCAGEGHRDWITGVAFSRDGRIVTASQDGTARVWNASTCAPALTLGGHGDIVSHAEFSRDGGRIVTTEWGGVMRLWDSRRGQLLYRLTGHSVDVNFAAFTRSGHSIISVATNRRGPKIMEVMEWDASLEDRPVAALDKVIARWVPQEVFTTVVRQADAPKLLPDPPLPRVNRPRPIEEMSDGELGTLPDRRPGDKLVRKRW